KVEINGAQNPVDLCALENNLCDVFKNSSICLLRIKTRMDSEMERKLNILLKNIEFKELEITFCNDYSGRFLLDLVRDREGMKSAAVRWEVLDKEVENAEKVLLDLPPMDSYAIRSRVRDRQGSKNNTAILHNILS
ncbi:hypothetical protein PMAYCL1PPCAC_05219, partial [Pristionchus mayeri]